MWLVLDRQIVYCGTLEQQFRDLDSPHLYQLFKSPTFAGEDSKLGLVCCDSLYYPIQITVESLLLQFWLQKHTAPLVTVTHTHGFSLPLKSYTHRHTASYQQTGVVVQSTTCQVGDVTWPSSSNILLRKQEKVHATALTDTCLGQWNGRIRWLEEWLKDQIRKTNWGERQMWKCKQTVDSETNLFLTMIQE